MTLPVRILNNCRVSLRSDSLILECQLLPDSPPTCSLARSCSQRLCVYHMACSNTHDSTATVFLQLVLLSFIKLEPLHAW